MLTAFTPVSREGELAMELNGQVGETAGEVWRSLHKNGPQTLAQLRKRLNGSGALLSFAVGWLARENKLEILVEKKSFRLQLK